MKKTPKLLIEQLELSKKNDKKSKAVALTLREWLHNVTGFGATKVYSACATMNNRHYLFMEANSDPFDDESHIESALTLNSSSGTAGAQGSGMKLGALLFMDYNDPNKNREVEFILFSRCKNGKSIASVATIKGENEWHVDIASSSTVAEIEKIVTEDATVAYFQRYAPEKFSKELKNSLTKPEVIRLLVELCPEIFANENFEMHYNMSDKVLGSKGDGSLKSVEEARIKMRSQGGQDAYYKVTSNEFFDDMFCYKTVTFSLKRVPVKISRQGKTNIAG